MHNYFPRYLPRATFLILSLLPNILKISIWNPNWPQEMYNWYWYILPAMHTSILFLNSIKKFIIENSIKLVGVHFKLVLEYNIKIYERII